MARTRGYRITAALPYVPNLNMFWEGKQRVCEENGATKNGATELKIEQ
jgi:hypothetical protein